MPALERERTSVPVGDGVELYVELVRGSAPDATPLVVPSASWVAADMDALCGRRTVVFYDVRGRGRSSAIHDMARLGLERDVEDLETLRAHLGLARMAVLGWSYHAAIAARYALARPERIERLLLVGAVGPRQRPHFADFLDRFARRCDPEKLHGLTRLRREGCRTQDPMRWCRAVHEMFFLAYLADPAHLARMQSSPCVEPNLDTERVNDQGRRVMEALGDYDWRPELAALARPVLLMHGSEDPIPLAGSREWAESLPDARLLVLDGIGHMPWLETPERFFAAAETFLAGDWPVPST